MPEQKPSHSNDQPRAEFEPNFTEAQGEFIDQVIERLREGPPLTDIEYIELQLQAQAVELPLHGQLND